MKIKRQNGYALAPERLLAWLAVTLLASLALGAALIASEQSYVDTWQLWARYTARLSFFLFLASYLSSPLYELAQNTSTDWLRRHRRNAGISFGLAHTIHLGALIGFLVVSGNPADMATIIVGGGAYLAMFAMLATSNDAAIGRMGQTAWRRLHKFGAHYLAFVFVFTYTNGYFAGYGKPLILIILSWAAIVLRIFVMIKSRREATT
jgi:DMSO/TMAO reductase YedYZ heme-binding membrane subunit